MFKKTLHRQYWQKIADICISVDLYLLIFQIYSRDVHYIKS